MVTKKTKKIEKKSKIIKTTKNNSINKSVSKMPENLVANLISILSFILIIVFGSITLMNLNTLNEKVSNLDNFFSKNVPGYTDKPSENAIENNVRNQENNNVVRDIDIKGEPFLGKEDAKITIVEFSDYRCPYCAKFAKETVSQLKKDYIQSGLVKLVFKDFVAVGGELSFKASSYANCVFAQKGNDAYFKMHDSIFATPGFDEEFLKTTAKSLGVDMEKIDTCVNDKNTRVEIQNDISQGQSLGVSGTPTSFINGKKVVGAIPYSTIKAEIEAALNN